MLELRVATTFLPELHVAREAEGNRKQLLWNPANSGTADCTPRFEEVTSVSWPVELTFKALSNLIQWDP